MYRYCKRCFAQHKKETAGLALFLAWTYCSLFGCGLATNTETLKNSLEHIWLFAGATEALGGLVLLAAVSRGRAFGRRTLLALAFAAAGLAVAGSLGIWFSYSGSMDLFWATHPAGGLLAGAGIALFTLLWGSSLASRDEAAVEFVVPAAFFLSFLLYGVILLTKFSSVAVLVVLALMPVLSSAVLLRVGGGRPDADAGAVEAGCACEGTTGRVRPAGSVSIFVLIGILWFQVALFRVLATPDILGDRFLHYLVPYSVACVIALGAMLACIRTSRYLNISLMARMGLPLLLLSYGFLYADYGDPALRAAAYTVNFVGMFCIQLCCWIGLLKYARKSASAARFLFGGFALGEGLGIFLGCVAGFALLGVGDFSVVITASIILMSLTLFVSMAVGYNPNWLFGHKEPRACGTAAPEGPDAAAPAEADAFGDGESLEAVFRKEARRLQLRCGLSDRETEIAALLLAGRSRPFIRDELLISLNTVHTHVGSIFKKCGVHTKQDLIDLAHRPD